MRHFAVQFHYLGLGCVVPSEPGGGIAGQADGNLLALLDFDRLAVPALRQPEGVEKDRLGDLRLSRLNRFFARLSQGDG